MHGTIYFFKSYKIKFDIFFNFELSTLGSERVKRKNLLTIFKSGWVKYSSLQLDIFSGYWLLSTDLKKVLAVLNPQNYTLNCKMFLLLTNIIIFNVMSYLPDY